MARHCEQQPFRLLPFQPRFKLVSEVRNQLIHTPRSYCYRIASVEVDRQRVETPRWYS